MEKMFLWGAATSSHQVEGGNTLNDWWRWEQHGKVKESSANACEHFQRFRDDFKIASELGHTAHRFSIEWSRLEPREGEWDQGAFEHYLERLRALSDLGIEPILTLHHFTLPVWFSDLGGWLNPKCVYFFGRYVEKVVAYFSRYVRFWITINEPLILTYFGYLEGTWPPGEKSIRSALKVFYHLIFAHIEAYGVIHNHYVVNEKHSPYVSIAKHLGCFTPARKNNWLDRLSVRLRYWFFNDLMLKALDSGFLFFPGLFCEFLPRRRTLDFIGFNYYTRDFIRFAGWGLPQILGEVDAKSLHPEAQELNMMGWEVYSEGLYENLSRLKKYNLPLMITENGICTLQDEQRVRYIQSHLAGVQRALDEGVNVWGYLYWSLLDNYEWAHGFDPRFGIVDVDYATQKRTCRKSAHVLSDLCRNISAQVSNAKRSL